MGNIDNVLAFNREFVASKGYEAHLTDKYPDKKLAVLSCMDTRLSVLLQEALGLKNGDAKIIKNAGALVPSPWDSAMRSLLVAVYELGVNEIMVVAHTNCGACQGMCPYWKSCEGRTFVDYDCDRKEGRCKYFCPRMPADIDALRDKLYGKDGCDAAGHGGSRRVRYDRRKVQQRADRRLREKVKRIHRYG